MLYLIGFLILTVCSIWCFIGGYWLARRDLAATARQAGFDAQLRGGSKGTELVLRSRARLVQRIKSGRI